MPKSKLLPTYLRFSLGTPSNIVYSNIRKYCTKKHVVYEIILAYKESLSAKPALTLKQLEDLCKPYWHVYGPKLGNTQIHYQSYICMQAKSKLICLYKQGGILASHAIHSQYAAMAQALSYYEVATRKNSLEQTKTQASDNVPSLSGIAQYLREFLELELQHIPYWYEGANLLYMTSKAS